MTDTLPGIDHRVLLTGLALAGIIFVLSQRGREVTVGNNKVPVASAPSPRTTIEYEEVARIVEFQISDEPLLSVPLLLAIIETESNFRIRAIGGAGEIGLMQIMPVTWSDTIKRAGLQSDLIGETLDPFNPRDNIKVGIAFLKLIIAELTQKLQMKPSITSLVTSFNVGVAGFLKGKTNTAYVEKIRVATIKWQAEVNKVAQAVSFTLPTTTAVIDEL